MNRFLRLAVQPVYEHRNLSSLGLTWFLLAAPVVLVPLFGIGLLSGRPGRWHVAFLFGLDLPLGLSAMMWWTLFSRSILFQNTPINARLVPKLRTRLMQTTGTLWAATSLGFAALLAIHFGHFIQIWVAVGVILISIASLFRAPRWLGLLYYVFVMYAIYSLVHMPAIAGFNSLVHMPAIAGFIAGKPLALVGAIILMLLIGMFVLRWLLPNGGDQHWRLQDRLTKMRAAYKLGLGGAGVWEDSSWIRRVTAFGYTAALRRDCARTTPSGRLLAYVFGPDCHWGIYVYQAGAMALIALATWLFNIFIPGFPFLLLAKPLVMMLAVVVPLISANTLASRMYQTRREQALLLLAPRSPQKTHLNRVLAKIFLGQFLFGWIFYCTCAVAFRLAFEGGGAEMAFETIAYLTVVLVYAGLPLRDYARMSAPTAPRNASVLALLMAPAMLLLPILFAVQKMEYFLPILSTFGVVFLIASAVITRFRWRRMIAAPVAFPAGRLA